jgi:hypothetical protein
MHPLYLLSLPLPQDALTDQSRPRRRILAAFAMLPTMSLLAPWQVVVEMLPLFHKLEKCKELSNAVAAWRCRRDPGKSCRTRPESPD